VLHSLCSLVPDDS